MRNKNITYLVQSSVLLAMAIVFQFIGSRLPTVNQYLVGSVVNATLLITAYLCGTFYGTAVGVLTPVTALLIGQLKAPMAPFMPFIMIGNAILVISFGLLHNKGTYGRYAGIILGAFLKFVFLSFSANKLIHILKISLPQKIAKALSISMGTTQLITALIGGVLALVLIEILVKRLRVTNEVRSAL